MTNNNSVTRVVEDDGTISETEFVYRGIIFERNDSLKGYWGHYRTWGYFDRVRMSDSTRRGLLLQIDQHIASKG